MSEEEIIIIRTGAATFDVIVGRKLNDKPLTKSEADELASAAVSPPPAKAPARPAPQPPEPPLSREEAMDRAAAKANAEMDAANARPIPAAAYAVDSWHGVGGSAGFSCNGVLWSGKKPQ